MTVLHQPCYLGAVPPIPVGIAALEQLIQRLQHSAELLRGVAGLVPTERYPAQPHPEIGTAVGRIGQINTILEKARGAGHVTAADELRIAGHLQAIADALKKSHGPRGGKARSRRQPKRR